MTQLWLILGFVCMVIGAVILGPKAAVHRREQGIEFSILKCSGSQLPLQSISYS